MLKSVKEYLNLPVLQEKSFMNKFELSSATLNLTHVLSFKSNPIQISFVQIFGSPNL
jgi:hypothetical protein